MSLERRDLTQIVTFSPPLPRVAFAIVDQGTSTDADDWGGLATDGKTYGWFLIDTTWWTQSAADNGSLNVHPLPTGSKFQVWSATSGNTFSPVNGLVNPQGAPDLIDINTWLHTVTPTDTVRRTIVATRQSSSPNQMYVYFSPVTSTTFNPKTDGIITVPEPRNPVWMGRLGHVSGLQYNWSKPGGPTQLTFSLTMPPDQRSVAIGAGRHLEAWRGGSCIWAGSLEEPQAGPTGWTITADGIGVAGANFCAIYSTWTTDNPVNEAIGHGLYWRNDGIGTPPGIFGLNNSNTQDSGSLTVSDFLNLLITSGALYWSIEPPLSVSMPAAPWVLRVREFPTDLSGNPLAGGVRAPEKWVVQEWQRIDLKAALNRVPPDLFIVNTTPVSRTLNGLYNTLVCRYKATPDIPATSKTAPIAATYATLTVDQPAAVAAQGRVEYFLDMTSADVMSALQVQQVAEALLSRYIKLSYAATYTVQPGRLLNNGGVPVDLALDWSGKMATVLVENAPVGGDVTLDPITFFIADYAFDDDSQTATITPYQSAGKDIQSLISEMYPNGFR